MTTNGTAEVREWLTQAGATFRPRVNVDVEDVIAATMSYVAQGRKAHQLADTVTVDVRVPYNPPMLALFQEAEPMLAEAFIALDWSDWQVWTVERDLVGDDWDPEPFVLCARGEYRVGASWISLGLQNATVNRVEPELTRRAAARLLAIAELAERKQAEALEAKP